MNKGFTNHRLIGNLHRIYDINIKKKDKAFNNDLWKKGKK
jgi:hypothetical protein